LVEISHLIVLIIYSILHFKDDTSTVDRTLMWHCVCKRLRKRKCFLLGVGTISRAETGALKLLLDEDWFFSFFIGPKKLLVCISIAQTGENLCSLLHIGLQCIFLLREGNKETNQSGTVTQQAQEHHARSGRITSISHDMKSQRARNSKS